MKLPGLLHQLHVILTETKKKVIFKTAKHINRPMCIKGMILEESQNVQTTVLNTQYEKSDIKVSIHFFSKQETKRHPRTNTAWVSSVLFNNLGRLVRHISLNIKACCKPYIGRR